MTIKRVLLFGAIAAAVGCTGQNPSSTEPSSQNAFEAQVPQADRQLMSVDNAEVENLIKQLPARISEADAASMLVEIKPESIADIESEGYSVLRSRGGGSYGGWRGGGGHYRSSGHYRGSNWRGGHYRGGRGYGYYGGHRGYLSSFRYYGLGGSYWPYYLNSGYYYPYFSGGYYPYMSLYNGLYNPFFYSNPYFNWGNPMWGGIGSGYMWPGMGGGQQGMQPPQQQQPQQQQPQQQPTTQPTASPTTDTTGTTDNTGATAG